MRIVISKYLFLLLAALIVGTGQVFAADGDRKGDANGDNVVDVTDATIIISKFHNISEPSFPLNADANGDGVIDVTDATIIISLFHYGSIDATGIISGWTEGNSGEELEPVDLVEEGYGD